jgi:hypothetical protein
MTQEQQDSLVFSDVAGNYYLVSKDWLEQAQVPEAQKAELQRLLSNEVQGYFTPVPIPGESPPPIGRLQLLGTLSQIAKQRFDGGGGIGTTQSRP